jgi:plasmid stabilization system protein ParE
VKPIEFHPGASQDAHDARDFYESKRLGLGDEFANELESSLRRIGENPKLYGLSRNSVRIAPLHRFPYAVYYRELPDRIWIAAVGHHRRRPGYWRNRRPN